MFQPSRRRFTVLFLLALALLAPWSSAAEAADVEEPAWSFNLQPWARFWAALGQLWALADPNGISTPASETAESGCSIDPDGRCGGGPGSAATVPPDEGCTIDPNGGCRD